MDLVICIIYIVTGGIWICKNIKLDSIVSPTNWRIMFIKLLMLFMIPLALYIFFYFSILTLETISSIIINIIIPAPKNFIRFT